MPFLIQLTLHYSLLIQITQGIYAWTQYLFIFSLNAQPHRLHIHNLSRVLNEGNSMSIGKWSSLYHLNSPKLKERFIFFPDFFSLLSSSSRESLCSTFYILIGHLTASWKTNGVHNHINHFGVTLNTNFLF